MTTKQDLLALAERVEKGDKINLGEWKEIFYASKDGVIILGLLPWVSYEATSTFYSAIKGSLDAAKALHDAVLPGWGYCISDPISAGEDSFYVEVFQPHRVSGCRTCGRATSPAAAWVAAILRAKAEEAE